MVNVIKPRQLEKNEALVGFESLGSYLLPGCTSTIDIPFLRGVPSIGLDGPANEKLRKKFEDYFNVDFNSPQGLEFLSNYQININHEDNFFNVNNVESEFIIHILKHNGGMGIVALDANDASVEPFVLQDEGKDMKIKVDKSKVEAEAISTLLNLQKKSPTKLEVIAKYIFDNVSSITNPEIAFTRMFERLTGPKKHDMCLEFLSIYATDMETVEVTVLVKEAIAKNVIRHMNGFYENYADRTKLGRNMTEIVNFLKNPANSDILGNGTKEDKPSSIRIQLVNKHMTGMYQ